MRGSIPTDLYSFPESIRSLSVTLFTSYDDIFDIGIFFVALMR